MIERLRVEFKKFRAAARQRDIVGGSAGARH
jgi:hypothetical protein